MRNASNLFTGAAGISDGFSVGPSEAFHGQGGIKIITLDNPYSAGVQLQSRPVLSDVQTIPDWQDVGGTAFSSKMRFNLFMAGYEFRGDLRIPPKSGKVRMSMRSLDQAKNELREDLIIQTFTNGQFVGLTLNDDNDFTQMGDVDGLLRTNAFLYLCYDTDPAKLAVFGGTWERFGGDYRKLHISSGTHVLLSTAIENFVNGGGSTGGGTGGGTGSGGSTGGGTGSGGGGTTTPTNAGQIGGPPIARTGTAALTALPNPPGLTFSRYSDSTGELFWPSPIDYAAGDKYELVLNNTIIQKGNVNSYYLTALSVNTSYTATVRRYRDDNTFSEILSRTFTTETGSSSGGGGGGGGTTTPTSDGANTTTDFVSIDAASRSYVQAGQQNPAQVFTTGDTIIGFSGAGYLVVSGTDAAVNQGAKAYFLSLPAANSDRKVWLRINAASVGDRIGGRSDSNGTLGFATATSGDWEWVQVSTVHATYDASYQLHAVDGEFAVDKVMIAGPGDNTVPTGKDGFKKV